VAHQTNTAREVVETVVFVVVLVLLLKSFTAEAFVIPTGSMAETLYGYQKMVDCPQCGHVFPVNCSSEVDPQQGDRTPVRSCTCPNCFYHIDFEHEARFNPNWKAPDWSSGDRVLVAKFLYDLLGRTPDRLDVVVFKFPGNSFPGSRDRPADPNPWPLSGPQKNHVPMNYIKRLVGLPGETIVIHGGSLYYLLGDAPGAPHYPDDLEKARQETDPPQLWRWKYMHVRADSGAQDFFAEHRDQLRIMRKAPKTVLAMRRLVYDNDHPARDLTAPEWERWAAGGGWKASRGEPDKDGRRPAAYDHPAGAGGPADWLRYRHLRRGGGGKPSLITDFMGYNSYHTPPGENWVGDLLVECDAEVRQAAGTLDLEVSRGPDRFRARFDLAAGTCRLLRVGEGGGEQELATAPAPVSKPGTYRLRLANFDQRLTVWVDNTLPFGDGVPHAPPAKEGPVPANDLEPAGVGASRAADVAVRGLRLWRNTYYTLDPGTSDAGGAVNFADRDTWGPLAEPGYKTMYVQPGHYLCLGDNSPESSDGRSWGLVPERLLLGRALLVYYPCPPFGNRGGPIR
jgi:signal peptidase I